MPDIIKILLADDHYLLRRGISSILEKSPNYFIVGEVNDGQQLIDRYSKLSPDLVICDISMPIKNGFQALTEIKRVDPFVKFLFISMYDEKHFIKKAWKLGGKGFLSKSAIDGELFLAIETIIQGKNYYDSNIDFEDIIDKEKKKEFIFSVAKKLKNSKLTYRQEQILDFISQGFLSDTISERLNISKRTVDMYRSKIMKEMDFDHPSQLIIYAVLLSLKKENKPIDIDLISETNF